jgi:hypothetical protein
MISRAFSPELGSTFCALDDFRELVARLPMRALLRWAQIGDDLPMAGYGHVLAFLCQFHES